jgi:hypothetical protein
MILYYAIGGGLGHLTRARAVIHTLGLDGDIAIMTASRFARDRRVIGTATPIEVRPELAGDRPSYIRWLRATIDHLAPDAIYVDAFPGGILGELCAFPFPPSTRLFHIARLLRWERYRELLTSDLPCFERTYRVESLLRGHEDMLREASRDVVRLDLRDPPSLLEPELRRRIESIAQSGAPLWLLLHSGPEHEVEELLRYADCMALEEHIEPQLIVASQSIPAALPARAIHLDLYPAHPLLPFADRIITGCGFNAMRQAAPYRDRHRCMPFERHYDDQEMRGEINSQV